jgi:hypothetical protein
VPALVSAQTKDQNHFSCVNPAFLTGARFFCEQVYSAENSAETSVEMRAAKEFAEYRCQRTPLAYNSAPMVGTLGET